MTPEDQAKYRAVRPVKCCREAENLTSRYPNYTDKTRWVERCNVCGRNHHVMEAEPTHTSAAALGI